MDSGKVNLDNFLNLKWVKIMDLMDVMSLGLDNSCSLENLDKVRGSQDGLNSKVSNTHKIPHSGSSFLEIRMDSTIKYLILNRPIRQILARNHKRSLE